jgi:hypothetical protein
VLFPNHASRLVRMLISFARRMTRVHDQIDIAEVEFLAD